MIDDLVWGEVRDTHGGCNFPNAHVVLFINIVHIILIIAPIKLINLMVRALPFRRTRLEVQIVYITLLNNGD